VTYVVMDNWVYGLTKKQTSPTSPLGFKSKTDIWGPWIHPINPMKQAFPLGLRSSPALRTPIRTTCCKMMEAAMDHDGFSFVECLSECVEFYEGAFDASNPRKGGAFNAVPADHDVTDEIAAYNSLASHSRPLRHFLQGYQGDKNAKEAEINTAAMEKPRASRIADSAKEF